MGTVDENVGHAQAVIFGKSAAYGEGDVAGDTYQIEGDQGKARCPRASSKAMALAHSSVRVASAA